MERTEEGEGGEMEGRIQRKRVKNMKIKWAKKVSVDKSKVKLFTK